MSRVRSSKPWPAASSAASARVSVSFTVRRFGRPHRKETVKLGKSPSISQTSFSSSDTACHLACLVIHESCSNNRLQQPCPAAILHKSEAAGTARRSTSRNCPPRCGAVLIRFGSADSSHARNLAGFAMLLEPVVAAQSSGRSPDALRAVGPNFPRNNALPKGGQVASTGLSRRLRSKNLWYDFAQWRSINAPLHQT